MEKFFNRFLEVQCLQLKKKQQIEEKVKSKLFNLFHPAEIQEITDKGEHFRYFGNIIVIVERTLGLQIISQSERLIFSSQEHPFNICTPIILLIKIRPCNIRWDAHFLLLFHVERFTTRIRVCFRFWFLVQHRLIFRKFFYELTFYMVNDQSWRITSFLLLLHIMRQEVVSCFLILSFHLYILLLLAI